MPTAAVSLTAIEHLRLVGMRFARSAAIALALLAVAGCDSGGSGLPGDTSGAPPSADSHAPQSARERSGKGPIARDGPLAARLLVEPRIAQPGDALVVRMENVGSATAKQGACTGAQRRRGNRWVSANKEIFGREQIACIAILYAVAPGEIGPRLGGRGGAVKLPKDLESGRYRLVTGAYSGASRRPEHRIRLLGPFHVR